MVKKNKIKCLITGGSGFLGSHLADELSSKNMRLPYMILKNRDGLTKNKNL